MDISVHFLPTESTAADATNRNVVVIDVLRATTTIVQALWSAAREVIPCFEIDEARAIAQQQGSSALLGGERGGLRIAGFDLGNSPAEYVPAVVANRTIVITTTNGTRAMRVCQNAVRVFMGSFLNLTRTVQELAHCESIALVCAGTDGRITREDVLLAGAIIDGLAQREGRINELNDEAEIAIGSWRSEKPDPVSANKNLVAAMRRSRGGRNLMALDLAHDISLAAQVDSCPILAELRLGDWRIVRID